MAQTPQERVLLLGGAEEQIMYLQKVAIQATILKVLKR